MGAKYIFRLDDICENMDWDNYFEVKELFIRYGIKPIIGVIPNNQDKNFLKYPKCHFDFWEEVKELQSSKGWSVALHGYNHVYETNNPGMFKINYTSEFAGLDKDKQCKKIYFGAKILEEKNICIDAFMAPAHSLDEVTIECLKINGITTVTDGYSFYPYYDYGILFVPQLTSRPRKVPFGIWTWCLHTNNMSKKKINDLESFIKSNRKDIISFKEAQKYAIGYKKYKLQNFILRSLLITTRKLRG